MNTPANDTASDVTSVITRVIQVRDICDKPYVRKGVKYERRPNVGQHADIVPGVSIRLFGKDDNKLTRNPFTKCYEYRGPVAYDRTFRVGDQAVYDSYNLKYYGKIVSIGAKTITIEASMTRRGRLARLSIHDFNQYNKFFVEAKAEKEAADWMD